MTQKIFYSGNYSSATDLALLILRLAAGSFMLTHGWGKLMSVMAGPPYEFSDPIGLGSTLSLFLVAFAEGICSILVALGFAVRLTTIPIIIAMAVAAFVVHAKDAFFAKELPLLYLTVFFVLTIMGAGKYSIDRILAKTR